MNFKWSNGLNSDDEDNESIYKDGEKIPWYDFFEWNIHQKLWAIGLFIITLNVAKFLGFWLGIFYVKIFG